MLNLKFSKVIVECRIGTTTADVLYIDDTNPIFPQTIAIEAKDWAKPLTSDRIAAIDNLYRPSINSGEIDCLLIVGRHTLASSPRESVKRLRKVEYLTVEEFSASLMDFRALITHNTLAFSQHEAASNFIMTRCRDNSELMDTVTEEWLRSDRTGLIIYGGYGLGKTTYSLHLAKRFSDEYNSLKSNRIPIRIALGGMYTKQDLRALICSALSGGESGVSVPNFSYHLFLEMNRNGQFILILDGFDEMRHAMDLDDFVYTFQEMQPLFSGKAKVILLGRPDSFLSNDEEERVLAGLFDLNRHKIEKREVAFFSGKEILQYVDNYIANRGISLSAIQKENFKKMIDSLPDAENNVLSRPVQLKMFTAIMEEALSDGESITRYRIYQKFIYRFLSREQHKMARRGDGKSSLKDERALFMQDMAWWVLSDKKENRFLAAEIPLDIVPTQIKAKGRTKDALIRESLVGSVIEPISRLGVLDRKAKKYYYFPHKSYIEFLVTEYFVRDKFSIQAHKAFMGVVNSEILSFIEERETVLGEGEFSGIAKLREGLNHTLGPIDIRVAEICAKDVSIRDEIARSNSYNKPSHIYMHYLFIKNCNKDSLPYLQKKLAGASTTESTAAALNCICTELEQTGSESAARALFVYCFTTCLAYKLKGHLASGQEILMTIEDRFSLLAAALLECVSLSADKSAIVLSLLDLGIVSERGSRGSIFVPFAGQNTKFRVIKLPLDFVFEALNQEWVDHLRQIIKKRSEAYKLFPIILQGKAASFLT